MSSIRYRAALVAATFAFSGLVAGSSEARPLAGFYGAGSVVPEGVQPGLFDAEGRACVKQCPSDSEPCDPPRYKSADGRCTTQWR